MKTIGGVRRPEQVEFFLRLWGLWEGVIGIPPPPKFGEPVPEKFRFHADFSVISP
jgi:hypothetical protein